MAKRHARPNPHPGPRVHWAQKPHASDAPDAILFASRYGLTPDDWQDPILFSWLGRRRDGKWCHGRCGLAVPRQNGKNGVLEVRELFGMVFLGEAILHTAHEVKTARKAFKRLKHFFGEKADDPSAKFPELNDLVSEVRNTNGQEAIVLKSIWEYDGEQVRSTGSPGQEWELVARGGSVEFVARSSGSGRGFTVDVLVLDEAQHLDDDELEAIRSAVSSAPLGNPQVIYMGTPPDRDKGQTGVVWHRIRSGSGKKKRLCWIEYGAPDGPMPDLDDIDALFAHNPALGLRHANGAYGLQMDTIKDERDDLSDEGYARERYGWWGDPKTKHESVINLQQWSTLKVSASEPTKVELVVDVSPNLEWSSIGLASDGPEGKVLILVEQKPGTGWVVPKVIELAAKLHLVEAALTPNAQIFSARLTRAKVEHHLLTNTELGRGCTAFQEAVRQSNIAHVGQKVLDAAVGNSKTRMVGLTQHWDQRDMAIDITPLVATSVAAQRWAMNTAKPNTPPPAPVRTTKARAARADSVATAGF